jgi:hypothetical protein
MRYLLLLCAMCCFHLSAQDFRVVNWGDSPEKVKEAEKSNKVKLNEVKIGGKPVGPIYMLSGLTKQNKEQVGLGYFFINDSLFQAQYTYNLLGYNNLKIEDYVAHYNMIKQNLIQQHGKPSVDTLDYRAEWKLEGGATIECVLEKNLVNSKGIPSYQMSEFVLYKGPNYSQSMMKLKK